MKKAFENPKISSIAVTREGLTTADNSRFLRFWFEVKTKGIDYKCTSHLESFGGSKWFPHVKGGSYRKWNGNLEYVVNWENGGYEIQNFKDKLTGRIRSHNYNLDYIFKELITWSTVSKDKISMRYVPGNMIFDTASASLFSESKNLILMMGLINSVVSNQFLQVINPTVKFQPGNISAIPLFASNAVDISKTNIVVTTCIAISGDDWDSYETSWNFTNLPLLEDTYQDLTLRETYQNLRLHWNEMTLEMQALEEENNRIFIEAYDLEDELTPEVPLEEITLIGNPHYRYRDIKNKSDEKFEALLLADTMKELISYSVGCMFGRYSLDKPGLILANQGETYNDYINLVPNSSFPAAKHNAIPILDGDWFADDIVAQFRRFLRVTFGEAHFEANLRFIEEALGKDVRTYFLRDFYNDHVRRYKNRPIYWMFSSPDGSFNALIYMHRYTADTVSIVRSEYLREYMSKLFGYISNEEEKSNNPNLTKGERTRALKEITKTKKAYDALEKYEQDVLFPLATERIEIDLDDGVRVNYPKFGPALKKIAGLS